MRRRYSIAEARANLSRLVDEAEAGVEVELTRRGRPVAVVVAPGLIERLREGRRSFGEAYGAFLKRYSLGEVGLDPGEADAWRDRSTGRRVKL